MQMKRKMFILVCGLMLMSLCGCVATMVTEQAANQAAPPTVDNSSFDVSTPGVDVGTLMVQTRQPSYQLVVDKYAIKIDSNSPLVVSKQSDTDIKLDAGKHTLKFYACSDNPEESEKASFGYPTQREIVIIKDSEQKLKYTGPWRLLGEGKVEVIQ